MISTPYLSASAITSSPAQTRVSLLANPILLPARIAAKVGFKPTIPTMAVMTQSASAITAASIRPSSPHSTFTFRSEILASKSRAAASDDITASLGLNSRHCWAMRSTFVPAVNAHTEMSIRLIISRLCRPIEPVEPKIDTHFTIISPLDSHRKQEQKDLHQRCNHDH